MWLFTSFFGHFVRTNLQEKCLFSLEKTFEFAFQFLLITLYIPKPLDCVDALGMESGTITDGQITASSSYDSHHLPSQGRLHLKPNGDFIGAWAPYHHDIDQWLQVDLRSYYIKITRIATQGRPFYHMHWVTLYNLQCSDDCADSFIYYVEDGQGVYKVNLGQYCPHNLNLKGSTTLDIFWLFVDLRTLLGQFNLSNVQSKQQYATLRFTFSVWRRCKTSGASLSDELKLESRLKTLHRPELR